MANQSGKAKRKSAPVSSHPLFPAIVALWFAALFGLGSLAIRPTLLEAFVLAAHIDTLVPAAAPPLGVTARILLALVLAVAGGLAGAAIAKRITRPKVEARERKRGMTDVSLRARDTHPDAPARRPISAHDEIGGTRIAPAEPASGAYAGRRRALAIHDEGTSADFHDYAPLPGGAPQFHEPQVLDLAEIDLGAFEEIDALPDHHTLTEQPVEPRQIFGQPTNLAADAAPLADFSAPAAEFAGPTAAFAPPVAPFAAPEFPVASQPPAASLPDFAPPPGVANGQIASASLGSLGLTELTERFALSLQHRREAAERAAAAEAEAAAAAAIAAVEPVAAMPEVGSEPAAAPPLFARMGASLFAAPAEPAVSTPMAMPAGLRPLNFDDHSDEDGEDFASFLPLRRMTMPTAPVESPVEAEIEQADSEEVEAEASIEAETDIDEDDGYSSLLGLSRPTPPRQQFIRIDEPEAEAAEIEPVVIFPGQAARGSGPAAPFAAPAPDQPGEVTALRRFDAPASAVAGQPIAAAAPTAPAHDAEETERALRAALATLQRMSGAA